MDTLEAAPQSTDADLKVSGTSFLPLPIAHGQAVRLLGPRPEKAATVVDPLVKLDEPLGVIQACIGGICTSDGRLAAPLEFLLTDPRAIIGDEVPASALIESLAGLPGIAEQIPLPPAFEVIRQILFRTKVIGPLLYCRKRHGVFESRSKRTLQPLSALNSKSNSAAAVNDSPGALPLATLVWDGPAGDGQEPAIYGGAGGESQVGKVESHEQLLLDQGVVASTAALFADTDPLVFAQLSGEHLCCACVERERCYPPAGGYAFVLDRLSLISATELNLVPLPLGEFRLTETATALGRGKAFSTDAPDGDDEFAEWRRGRVTELESAGPPFLLTGESNGRDLVEICRLKLGLFADALEQLHAGWTVTGRPHLCWNDETLRVTWQRTPKTPSSYWGFNGLLRKVGMHPASLVKGLDGRPMAYPPVFSRTELLPSEAVEAMRYFNLPGRGTAFIKSSVAEGAGMRVQLLLEDTNIPRRLFCAPDVLRLTGDGWSATLGPAPAESSDGEGLPFSGIAVGHVAGLKAGEQVLDCGFIWYPRFGEACDMHALGMLLLETLVAHDEQSVAALREKLAAEREGLALACMAVEPEQRNHEAANWIALRCDNDAPGSIWSRRTLLFRRDERSGARLDAFPPLLWQAVVMLGFRMITSIPGFSFCGDRAQSAPRTTSDALLPLLEMRGLLAMMDDLIFGRSATVDQLGQVVKGAP